MMDKSIGSEKTIAGGLEEIQSLGDMLTQRQRKRFKAGDKLLGRYRILGELGQGGMGLVFRCLDEVGGIEVAVKMLPPEVGHDSGEMEEVRENFALVAGLAHPNIATVRTLEKDPATGEYFLVMELAQGVNLRAWRKAEVRGRMSDVRGSDGGAGPPDPPKPGAPGGRALPLETILPIVRQIAAALDYAHEHKVIHRDIKPSNVMVQPATCNLSPSTCTVKVLDFGLAAQIHTSFSRISQVRYGTSGTGPYMAPEQWRGEYQDGATDQYALAVLAYELIAGHCPFESHETTVLKQAVLDNEPKRPVGLPETAWQALKQGLAKNREDRFASCADFATALGGDREKLRNAPNARKGTANGRKWTRIVAGLLALAGLAAGIWGWRSIQEPGFRSQNGADGAGTAGSVVGQGVDLAGSGSDGRAGPLDPPNENGAPGGRALPDTSPMATEDQQSEPVSVPVGFGHAKIQTTPEGALVTLAGQVATSRPVAVFRNVPARPQPVRVELEHYRIQEFDLAIPVDKFAETNVVLAKRQGKLDLATDPPGAAIWTNGVDAGCRTPWVLTHAAGTVNLKFTLAGRRAWETNAPVKGDATTEIGKIALVPESGSVRVVATVPKEAQAYFNGLEKTVRIGSKKWQTNALPATWDGLDCGETDVQVEAPGFDSAPIVVVVEDQAITNAAVALTPKLSRIKFTSNVADAEIIDSSGNRLGKVGDELKLAPFVTQALSVRAEGYKDGGDRFVLPEPDKRFAARNVVLEEFKGPVPGRNARIENLGLDLIWVASGSFRMGSENGDGDEKPVRTVQLTQGNWMGKTEVTQGQWKQVMGINNMRFKSDDLPVKRVSWEDATKFCEELTRRERANLPQGYEYRLPTEAEWEYAARGGTKSRGYEYSGGDDPGAVAWYTGNSATFTRLDWTHPVGKKGANELGLCDMSGNVWEWCWDWYQDSYGGLGNVDPSGPQNGLYHVLRGGGWRYDAFCCRVACRYFNPPQNAYDTLGFRVVLAAPVQ